MANATIVTDRQTDRQTDRYVSLQLLRIIACLGVFTVHFGQRIELTGWIRQITDFGRYGVHLFFIISGFLAAKGFAYRKESILTYYKKRAIHIIPLYALSILWFVVTENILNFYLHQIPIDEKRLYWLRYILFLNGFVNSDTYFWSNLGITWTIPLFVWFYILFPIMGKKTKEVKSAILIMIMTFFVTKVANHFYQCNLFSYIWIFFLGVVLFYAVRENRGIECTIVLQVFAITAFVFDWREYAYSFMFSSMLLLSVMIEDKIRLPHKIMSIVNYLDQRTYTMYLVHGIIFCSLIDRLYIFKCSVWVKGIIAISLSAVGTVLIYQFYEKPVQKWLTTKLIKRET